MKITKRKNKQADEMIVSYRGGKELKACRFGLLKSIIETEQSVTLIVDTNQKIRAQSIEPAESYLQQAGIEYISKPVSANPSKLFGFNVKGKSREERMLITEINGEQFTKQFYSALESYDIAIGIGRTKSLSDTYECLRMNEGDVLFNPEFFKESIYDSVVCSAVRSSMDIRKLVEAASDETAL